MNKEVRSTPARVADFHHAKNTLPKKILLHFVIITIYTLFGKWKIEEEENMFKITLRTARELNGYTVEEVANQCGLTEECYRAYEDDFGKAPAKIAFMVHSLFKISLDSIYIGE